MSRQSLMVRAMPGWCAAACCRRHARHRYFSRSVRGGRGLPEVRRLALISAVLAIRVIEEAFIADGGLCAFLGIFALRAARRRAEREAPGRFLVLAARWRFDLAWRGLAEASH